MPNSNSSGGQMMMIAAVLVCFCLFLSSVATGVLMYKKNNSSSSSSNPESTSSSSNPESTSSSSNSKPTSSSYSSKPVYDKVGTIGECITPAYYTSLAWSPDIIDSNDPKTTAAEFGDTRYNTWVNRATDICNIDPQCNAVSVSRDGVYKKYQACTTVNNDPYANSFKNKNPKIVPTLADPPSGPNVYKRIKINDTMDNVNMCVPDINKGSHITNNSPYAGNIDACKWNYDPVTQQLTNKLSGYCINNNKPGGTVNDLIQTDCDPNEVANKFNHDKTTKRYESVKNPGNYLHNIGWQDGTHIMVFPGVPHNAHNVWETAWYAN